jgi:hypothetical protein
MNESGSTILLKPLLKQREAKASVYLSTYLLAYYFFFPPAGAGDLPGVPTGPFAGGLFPLLGPEGLVVLLGAFAGAFVAIVTS